jgi:hypothetical protein
VGESSDPPEGLLAESSPCRHPGSIFQVELAAQPVGDRFDHVAPLRVLPPSAMITTFQECSWGTTEIAKSVDHSQMSSISILIGDIELFARFASFFRLVPHVPNETPTSAIRASA